MKRAFVALGLLLVLCYGLFEARRLLAGPQLIIDTPINGSATTSPIVTVTGRVANISFLTINGKTASANEQGEFVYRYSPPPGYTALTARASDRFGRQVEQRIAFNLLTYCPVTLI